MDNNSKLTRIGVFYDGNFFFHVSNYYLYHHERRCRIGIAGLHRFIREEVAKCEGTDARYCQIVDAHYFRGRLAAAEAQDRDLLFKERSFEDVLMREGVVTHYLPLVPGREVGIDVWFALEAFESAMLKRFNVSVLVAGDGDYVPLVRKLNTIGTRIMVMGWDFKYVDKEGIERETRTSQALLNEVTYPVLLSTIIDDRARRNDPVLRDMFIARRESSVPSPGTSLAGVPELPVFRGTIQAIKEGYGFLTPEAGGDNLFFYHLDVLNKDFNDLHRGDRVEYVMGTNDRGPCAKRVRATPSEPTFAGQIGDKR